jgi:hypothetical protein
VNVPTITGKFDAEQELVTAEPFEIEVDADATVDAGITSISLSITVSASADLTTGQSGELQGSAEGLDTSSANVTLVSNDFTVPATGETVSVPVVGDIDIDEQVGLPADDPSRNYLELELDMDISEVFGTVEGTATNQSGTPATDVTLQFYNDSGGLISTVATDGSGGFSVGLQPGSYDLVVSDPRYVERSRPVTVEDNVTKTIELSVEALDFGTVTGTVIDANDTPLDGVEVSVTNTVTGETVATATTSDTGRYSAEIVAGNTHEVSASETGFGQDSKLVSIGTDGETTTATLQLGTPPDPGTVYGALDGLPVNLDPPQDGVIALTDPQTGELVREVPAKNMSFEFEVPPGEYGIAFNADGFTEYADTVTVPEGGLKEYNIPLDVELPPVVGGRPPKDIDGDNTYENVRGNGEFTILDVQALFTKLESPAIQDNAWAYNFSGTDETEVTITDVQALFNKLSAR